MAHGFEDFPALAERLYTRPDHYAGETFEGTATLIELTRDSDLLDQSNWAACEKEFANDESVFITRAGHWACGWIDTMRVAADASDEVKQRAEDILNALAEYPILDEEDFSERELEATNDYWNGWRDESNPDYKLRLDLIREYNESYWWHKVPFLAARHCLYTVSQRYDHFGQWIEEKAVR